jgi:hypothetical protein
MITAVASNPAIDQLLTFAELVPGGTHGQWGEVSVPEEQRVGCRAPWVPRCSAEMLAVGTGAAREAVLVGPDGVRLRARTEVVGAFTVDHADTFADGLVERIGGHFWRDALARAANVVVAGARSLSPQPGGQTQADCVR